MKKKMLLFKYTGNVVSSITSILRTDKKYEDSPYILDDVLYAMLVEIVDKKLSTDEQQMPNKDSETSENQNRTD